MFVVGKPKQTKKFKSFCNFLGAILSMKKNFVCIILTFLSLTAMSQKMIIITLDNSKIDVSIVSETEKQKLIDSLDGKQDNTLRKQWTARTYRLSDNSILIEFYDKQAVLINNIEGFDRLQEVRFIKTHIWFLKKNISYKIEISYEKGKELVHTLNPKKLDQFKSELLDFASIEVYELSTGQLLFLSTTTNSRSAVIYENIKALASESDDVLNQYYGDMEKSSMRFVKGDPLLDYETREHLVYPNDLQLIIQNHKLALLERKVYVEHFYGNLYKSENGYYILIDEVNQKSGAGNKKLILTARVYESIEDVRGAQAKYEKFKNEKVRSEHFYQKISDRYGKEFPLHTKELIDSLPIVLNFDKEQLTFDDVGMTIVDEAIHWNHSNYSLFDVWYPSVLAYYGECYMTKAKDAKWEVKKEKDYNVWTPHLILSTKEEAFDVYDFFKSLSEWPIPIKLAGDWDGWTKEMRKRIK